MAALRFRVGQWARRIADCSVPGLRLPVGKRVRVVAAQSYGTLVVEAEEGELWETYAFTLEPLPEAEETLWLL